MKEEKNSSNKIQKIMGKRWVLPGVYLAVAAGLLSAVFFMQNGDEATEQVLIQTNSLVKRKSLLYQ